MFRFQLVSISGKKFDDEVYEVVLPTMDGQIGVLSHHMPLVSAVSNGAIMVRRTAKDPDHLREFYATNGGVIEFSDNTLRVLVDEADAADDLNESEVQKALERAQRLKSEAKDQVSLEHAQQLVDRHQVRLQVANLKRRHPRR